jgi:drug/metabolite transporter (DMT)-like permease
VISVLPELRGGTTGLSTARLLGMASAAAAALSFAFVMLLARHQSHSNSVWTILLLQTVLPMLLLAAPAAWMWKPVPHGDLALIRASAALIASGCLMLLRR